MFNHNLFFIDIHLAHIELLITRTQVLYLSKFCNDPMIGWTTPKIGIYAIVRKGASINHVDKAGGRGISQMSTLLNKPM